MWRMSFLDPFADGHVFHITGSTNPSIGIQFISYHYNNNRSSHCGDAVLVQNKKGMFYSFVGRNTIL